MHFCASHIEKRSFDQTMELPVLIGRVVERSEWEVAGSKPRQKALKWYQCIPCLVLSLIKQALALLLLNTNNI